MNSSTSATPSPVGSAGTSPAPRILVALIVVWLVAGYFVVPWLPASAGWENSWLENVQVVILLAGAALACAYARKFARTGSGKPAVALALCLVPIWLLLVGRELAWGAALLPPLGMGDDGPEYSSSVLWYKSAVAPAAAVVLVVALAFFARFRADRLIWPLLRTRHFPWLALALGVGSGVLSTYAEGHMGMHVVPGWAGHALVLEEWAEVAAYLSLVAAQWQVLDWARRLGLSAALGR